MDRGADHQCWVGAPIGEPQVVGPQQRAQIGQAPQGFANSAEFRAALGKGLQAIRDRHAVSYISDTRKIKVIVHEDQKWANETLIPLLAAAGLKRLAMVTAEAGLGKVTVEEIVKMVDNKALLMRTFDSMPAAMRWVKEA